MSKKIKPCIFCPSTAPHVTCIDGVALRDGIPTLFAGKKQVFCLCCGAAGPRSGTSDRAIELWNKIHSLIPPTALKRPTPEFSDGRFKIEQAGKLVETLVEALDKFPIASDEGMTARAHAIEKITRLSGFIESNLLADSSQEVKP